MGDAATYCFAVAGDSSPHILEIPCGEGARCVESATGATCESTASCVDGQSECRGDHLATCSGGQWQEEACDFECTETALGSTCRPNVPTTTYRNKILIEARLASQTGWSQENTTVAGRGLLVVSITSDGELLDAAVADNDGVFELDIPDPWRSSASGQLIIATVSMDLVADDFFGVFNPQLSPGKYDWSVTTEATFGGGNPHLWSWESSASPADSGILLTVDNNSGAAVIFFFQNALRKMAQQVLGASPRGRLVTWYGPDVRWTCGACAAPLPSRAATFEVANQIWLPAGSDEPQWSIPVHFHELGHWIMSTYGVSPREGGKHILGVPSHPGLAWSEGFATWMATSLSKGLYWDMQEGFFFWFNLRDRVDHRGNPFVTPQAAYGLEQLMDENWVAATLLGLEDGGIEWTDLLTLLASDRMTQPPFARGYRRRVWNGLNAQHQPLPYTITDESTPYLADFLDAAVCSDVALPEEVDAQTRPAVNYPYPSQAPLCFQGSLPVTTEWLDGAEPRVEVTWLIPLEADLELQLVEFNGKRHATTQTIPRGSAPGSVTLRWEGAPQDVTPGIRVNYQAANLHLSGVRPRTPPPSTVKPPDGPEVIIGGRSLGRAYRVVPAPAGIQVTPAGELGLPGLLQK